MKNKQKIAVIDSGIGGLDILSSLIKKFPYDDFIFLADEDYFPYGTKKRSDLELRLVKIYQQFIKLDIKMIIIACNTASAASSLLINECLVPVVGIIDITADYAKKISENKCIGIWATNGTIESGAYQNALSNCRIYPVSCSSLVPLIENNQIKTNSCLNLINQYLEDIKESDTLILGCTHFPLLSEEIKKINNKINLITSAIPIIEKINDSYSYLLEKNENNQIIDIFTTSKTMSIKEKIVNFDIKYNSINYIKID